MAFKMKGSPYGEKRSGEMDMKPRMSSNFDKSGIKNADGSDAKPGAPGLLGKIMDPLGLFKKGKKMLGGKNCPPAAAGATAPGAAAPGAEAAAATPATPGPAAPAAAPVEDPEAAPTQMRYKASPAKGKFTDMLKKGYDKASQVGMGVKAGVGRALDASSYGGAGVGYSTRSGMKAAKAAYQKEKKADIAMRKREKAAKKNK